jgi:hypothetical protein
MSHAKLIRDLDAIAAEAERLETERVLSEADEPLPPGVDPIQLADLIVTVRAMGDFHHPTTAAILNDCVDAVPDGGTDAGGDFLRAVVERGARYGIATTARQLLGIRAGNLPRWPSVASEAYAAHCKPGTAPKSEAARALLEDWLATAF